jgi:hypothetical protein
LVVSLKATTQVATTVIRHMENGYSIV